VPTGLAGIPTASQPPTLHKELEGLQTRAVLGDTGTETMEIDNINPGALALDDDSDCHAAG